MTNTNKVVTGIAKGWLATPSLKEAKVSLSTNSKNKFQYVVFYAGF
jgi:hypothetical protein